MGILEKWTTWAWEQLKILWMNLMLDVRHSWVPILHKVNTLRSLTLNTWCNRVHLSPIIGKSSLTLNTQHGRVRLPPIVRSPSLILNFQHKWAHCPPTFGKPSLLLNVYDRMHLLLTIDRSTLLLKAHSWVNISTMVECISHTWSSVFSTHSW